MAANCTKHPYEQATDICRTCGDDFCAEDLVYSHGANKPPFCIPCALSAAGVRRRAKTNSVRGRTRVGVLAAAGALVALAVPVISQLA